MSLGLGLGLNLGGRGAGGSAPSFIPSDNPNVQFFADAENTPAGSVALWDNQSGTPDATAAGTARPTSGTQTLGGLNALDFDGSSDVLTLGTDTLGNTKLFCGVSDAFTIIMSLQSSGNGTFLSKRETSQNLQIGELSGQLFLTARGAFNADLGAITGVNAIIAIRWNGANLQYSFGGTSWTTLGVSTEVDDGADILIGARTPSTPAFFLDGLYGGLTIADTALTDSDVNDISNYFKTKRGGGWVNFS